MINRDSHKVEVVVITLTINQKEQTLRCFRSLRSGKVDFKVLLWDNGSTDGTCEAVRAEFPHVLVHHNSFNLGAAGGRNAAVELAVGRFHPKYLLFLDNDTVVTDGFLDALIAPFQNDGKVAQTSAKIRFLNDQQRLNDAGGSRIRFWVGGTKPIGFGEIDKGQYNISKKCIAPTGCMLVRSDVFQKVGGFDTQFDPFGKEDLDLSLRIKKAGYYGLYVPKALIYHDADPSFKGTKMIRKYGSNKARNWFLFMRRHATIIEQLSFYFVGAPLILLKAVIHDLSEGNFCLFHNLSNMLSVIGKHSKKTK